MSVGTLVQTLAFYVLGCTACHQCVDRRARMKEVRQRLVEKGYHWGEEAQKISSQWRHKSSAAVCGLKPFRTRKSKSGSFSSSSVEGRWSPNCEDSKCGDMVLSPIYEQRPYLAYDHDKDCSYFLNSREGITSGAQSPCEAVIVPPINDYHPPVVSGQWARSETAWMTLPPPTSEKMTMLQRDAWRDKSASIGAVITDAPAVGSVRNCDGAECAGKKNRRRGSVLSSVNIQRPQPVLLVDSDMRSRQASAMTPIARPARTKGSREVRSRPPGSRPSSSDTVKTTMSKSTQSTITPNSSTGSLEGSPTGTSFNNPTRVVSTKLTSTSKPAPALFPSQLPKTTTPALLPSPIPKTSVAARKSLSPLIIPNKATNTIIERSSSKSTVLTTSTVNKLNTITQTTTSITTTVLSRSPNSKTFSSLYNPKSIPDGKYHLPKHAKDDSVVDELVEVDVEVRRRVEVGKL